ncbi:coiled-coil domain-containing protein 141 [Chanos chanos]|uniref:Coiled-coil domain-containing protein 141 n=1 Tax=Chanos chanos TaxID=29144 RepID=A0A6J2WCE7_CHACN|nr:coiled-coil domain-containing protein 141 [Chanos chanos]
MSGEGDAGGQPSTTTISTVAVQAGSSQVIIAVLKCGELIQLQLAEAKPCLLEIGKNQDETKTLLEEHEQLLTKLKKHEKAVYALLEEADKTAEEKVGEKQVYEAMAVSLGCAWTTLVTHLEKRRALLLLASTFFDRALEFAIKIDEAEDFQRVGLELLNQDCLNEVLQRHSSLKRGLLEKSMLVLNKSHELLDFLRDFQSEEALLNSGAFKRAHSSCSQVECLMEILQDRRRKVDQGMRQKCHNLEVAQRVCQWERQEKEVTHWLKEHADSLLENSKMGSSLSENEELLKEHREFELKSKDWSSLAERLLTRASELLAADGCTGLELISEKSQKLKALHEQFRSLMTDRLAHLQEINGFFHSANDAFEVLGNIESCLKGLRTQALRLPELAKKHEEFHRSAKDTAAEPLQIGQLILQRKDLKSAQVGGVQRMLGYIKERVDALSQECHAHRDLTARKQQLTASLETLMDTISTWLKSSHCVLSSKTEPGSSLSEAEDMLDKHLGIIPQTQDILRKSENIGELIKELRALESPEATEFSNKASLLAEELNTLIRNISARVDSLKPYVAFLRCAEEVEKQMKSLQECYVNRPQEEEEEENEEGSTVVRETVDTKWQSLLERFLTMQDLGNNFVNSSNMISEKINLNVKAAVYVVENTMESLNRKKTGLSDMWTSWQLQVNQLKSVKKQWKKFKDKLKKLAHDLRAVEELLTPAGTVDLGSDPLSVSRLQENLNAVKPQFLQLNAEIEMLVKTSELLALKGVPVKEKNEKISEFLQLHQQVKDKIKEYESILSMAMKFHQIYEELEELLNAKPVSVFSDTTQAKMQLSQHQEKQSHVRHLYKMAISLGADIYSTLQQSVRTVHLLQDKLERLESGSVAWTAEANKCEENLLSNVHCCVFKEEINELRESFKDLRKKFNNLKFNYMKKNERMRNLKAVKNQIQQIEIYIEKLQVLKKKLQTFTLKVASSTEKHLINSSPREIEDALNELQRQVGDFNRAVEEYKQNLDMTVKLQQAMEEYLFWCDEANATIVRVGKYSSQCKTKEAVSTLYKQFEKFVWPTIPQQEERINQITELAVKLHGDEEGKKYVEKTVSKHNEIVESVKELCNGLLELEAKLQVRKNRSKESSEGKKTLDTTDNSEPKESGHTPEMAGPGNGTEVPVGKRQESKKPHLRKTRSQDLPDKHHPENRKVLSETRSYIQEAYSKTITEKSTVQMKEQLHTSFCHTQTFNVSCYPLEKDRKIHVLHQTKRESYDTPPPPCHSAPSFSDIQRAFQKKEKPDSAQRTTHDKFPGSSGSNVPCTDSKGEASHPGEEEFSSQGAQDPATSAGGQTEGDYQQDHLTEGSTSNDEYECTSPDDISLPPLSETPESNIVQSENDLEDGYCISSHSLHVNQYSHQSHSQYSDTIHQRPEWLSSQTESYPSPTTGQGAKFRTESSSFVQSPLTVPAPSLVSNTISSILKSKPMPSQPSGTFSESHQTLYSVHESRSERQECVHDPSLGHGSSTRASNMHVSPTPLTTEQDPNLCKPTAIREEIRLPSVGRATGSLAGQGPSFSKVLSNTTVMEGSPVTLEVEVTGFPEPTLTWFKNGQKLTNDEHIQLSQKEGKCSLFIQMATECDAGLYEICASNSSTSISSSAVLQVKGNCCQTVNILKLDWHTCFGALCFLLWLLYLLLL